MSNKLGYFLLAALLLLGLSFSLHSLQLVPPPSGVSFSPDWFMTEVQASETDEAGHLKGMMTAPLVTHFIHRDVIDVQNPFFILYRQNSSPWHVNSDIAYVYQKKPQQIVLHNRVVIQEMPGKGSNETRLTTSSMTYFPDTTHAVTNALVNITQPGVYMQSKGLQADLNQGIIHFLSNVKVIYHAQTASEAP